MSYTPKISFILYVYKNTENLADSLAALTKFNERDVEIIIHQDPGSSEVDQILDNFFQDCPNHNITYIKNQHFLGQSFCFNEGLKIVHAPYTMFMYYNDVFDLKLLDTLNFPITQGYDIISIPSLRESWYPLESNEYCGLSKELILNCGVSNLRDKIFRTAYLLESKLDFEEDKWYPDVFMLKVLLTFNKWWNILGEPLVDIRKECIAGSNLYDFLYQVEDLFDLAIKSNIYETYKEEFDYWITIVCIYEFLSKIYANYSIHLTNKKSIEKNIRVIKLAMKHVTQVIDKYVPDFKTNKYFKKYATKTMKYFLKSEKAIF
ncbi:glycosyltransferase [Ureaplasma ceti]|uniref:Glycosyltransferase n=1 Tax=Ureaplasma ceti TaxID=3119530 RepID=A0ABP9U6H5_9BACT